MPIKQGPAHFLRLLGVEANTTSHAEKCLSIFGCVLGMALTCWLSNRVLGGESLAWLLASSGASAALIFAVPHGALSQPWPVVGGHLISALIGISCQQLLDQHELAVIAATGLSVAAMYYLRCLHPPGVATALFAVMGGAEAHQLGYALILNPVLPNALILLFVGIGFNNLFPSRRYPAALAQVSSETSALQQEDVAKALRQLDSFIDISAEDLNQLYRCANDFAQQRRQQSSRILRLPPRAKPQVRSRLAANTRKQAS